jgi:hypothetical protein
VAFEHVDASGYVARAPCDVVACLGASWIGGGVAGTIALLERSMRPAGWFCWGSRIGRGSHPTRRRSAAAGQPLERITDPCRG